MIYQYLTAVVFWLLLFVFYRKFKTKLPEKVTKTLSSNKVFTFFTALILTVIALGSPFRLESTSTTGKTSFKQNQQISTERVEGTPDPLSQDFRAMGEKFKQQAKETQDEINEPE